MNVLYTYASIQQDRDPIALSKSQAGEDPSLLKQRVFQQCVAHLDGEDINRVIPSYAKLRSLHSRRNAKHPFLIFMPEYDVGGSLRPGTLRFGTVLIPRIYWTILDNSVSCILSNSLQISQFLLYTR